MFRIQFKGDFFKIGKTKGIYDKTNKSFGEEMFPEQEDAGDKKWKKDNQNAERQIISGKFTYDNSDSGRTIINCIVRKQNIGDGKTRNKCACYNCKIRE